jgi:hypothetical protein
LRGPAVVAWHGDASGHEGMIRAADRV